MSAEPLDLDAIQALYDADMEVDDYVPALIAELRDQRRRRESAEATIAYQALLHAGGVRRDRP